MKRKGSHFLGFFGDVTGTQRVTSVPDGWIVDLHLEQVPRPRRQAFSSFSVPSLEPGFRWLYWVPAPALAAGGHHTALLFLDPLGQPVWAYFDIVLGSGLGDDGFPWTLDADLDVIVTLDDSGRFGVPELIDVADLEEAQRQGRVTPAQAERIWALARQTVTRIGQQDAALLAPLRRYLRGATD